LLGNARTVRVRLKDTADINPTPLGEERTGRGILAVIGASKHLTKVFDVRTPGTNEKQLRGDIG